MDEFVKIENKPQTWGSLLFGGFALLAWIAFFGYLRDTWPPSVLFIIVSIINLGSGLLFISGRIQDFDAVTWNLRDRQYNGVAYLPIWSRLAPYGGAIGVAISSILHYRMGAAAKEIIIPISLAIGLALSWMVVEHLIHLWHKQQK